MKKRVISMALAVLLLAATNIPAFAAETATKGSIGSGIHVMWTDTDDVRVMLYFSGTSAKCSCVIHGKSGTNKITATAYLRKVTDSGKTTVATWSGLRSYTDTLYMDKTKKVASGYTYELEIDAKVYRNGTAENISATYSDYCNG